jgi:catechol 2,3-dioxygenase-like lactoylglutathione lyase family enzyme
LPIDYTDNQVWAQFHAGEDISLAIEKSDPDRVECGSRLVGRFVGVTMVVDDIQETHQALLTKNVEFIGKPEKQAWGGTLVDFLDPDGNVLTLMESGD